MGILTILRQLLLFHKKLLTATFVASITAQRSNEGGEICDVPYVVRLAMNVLSPSRIQSLTGISNNEHRTLLSTHSCSPLLE